MVPPAVRYNIATWATETAQGHSAHVSYLQKCSVSVSGNFCQWSLQEVVSEAERCVDVKVKVQMFIESKKF